LPGDGARAVAVMVELLKNTNSASAEDALVRLHSRPFDLISGQRIGHLVLIDEDPALALHFGQERGELLIGELLLEQGADGAGQRFDGAGLC